MGAKNARNIWVPAVGEGLISGWEIMAAKLVSLIPKASPEAAQAVLDAAQAANIGATSDAPLAFLIGQGVSQVQYVADGSKTSGKWNLAPTSPTTWKRDTYNTPWSGTQEFAVAAGAYSNMMTSKLTAAPYDRVVLTLAFAYGDRVAGTPRFRLKAHDNTMVYGTFPDDPGSCTVFVISEVPKDATPSITAGLFGGGSTQSKVNLSGTENQNGMVSLGWPISMAV